ncbi:unnamed protein product [Phytophthora lilii]|uniref:Unnamed protein product n=1 Tax=Phytophthora lilii TaxID=2077276 RepID=A0A9W6XAP6_9STRA|nr:unnamed protein product [Phytophthora lilii]
MLEEWVSQRDLDRSADKQIPRRPENTAGLEQQEEQRGCKQQNVHLDGYGETEEDAAPTPALTSEQIHRDEQQRHGDAVVEHAQHEDGVQPLGHAEKHRGPGRQHSSSVVDGQDRGNHDEVDAQENVLRAADVLAVVRDRVQKGEDVQEAGRVHEWARVAADLHVVALAALEQLYLLHVRGPVDLRVCAMHQQTLAKCRCKAS